MYAVLGSSGNTGSVVVRELLRGGAPVRAVVRNPEKARSLREAGAEVAVAEASDVAALSAALRGVKAAYVMVPPHHQGDDMLDSVRRIADAIAAALASTRLDHVTLLSSIGTHQAAGTGPILGNRYLERAIDGLTPSLTILRPPYFMENWKESLGLLDQDKLVTMLAPETPLAMIATEDIGRIAASSLREAAPGKRVVALCGPREYSPHDVARALSGLLGRELSLAYVPNEAIVPTLTGAGLSANMAELYREMYDGIARGLVVQEDAGEQTVRGSTPLEVVLRKLLA